MRLSPALVGVVPLAALAIPPARAGCDKDHAGAEARVDHTASYAFFPEPAKR